MKLPSKKELQPLAWTAGILFISALAGTMFTATSAAGMFSLAVAIHFAADALERVIIGMVISSAMIPMYLYAINAAGFKVSLVTIMIGIILVVFLAIWYRTGDAPQQKTE